MPGCKCGFYAYGTYRAACDYAEARWLLAVVTCWGKVVPGTRGLRAQHARIEAIWLSARNVLWAWIASELSSSKKRSACANA